MVIKMNDVLGAINPLQKIRGLTFNGRAAFYIARLLNKMQQELDSFNEARKVITDKYQDKENPDKIAEENIENFNNEITALLNDEIEISASPLKLSWLEEMNFSIDEIYALEPFIEED